MIFAECSPINSALVTGFQMIAQLNNSSEVHKLHVNQSMDLQTPVTVEVEKRGMYQVTLFAIRKGTGIVGSFVGYIGHIQVVVGDVTTEIPGIIGLMKIAKPLINISSRRYYYCVHHHT